MTQSRCWVFTLTTLAAGRFSRNAFHLYSRASEQRNVTFIPFGRLNHTLLSASLRFEYANLYSARGLLDQQQPQLLWQVSLGAEWGRTRHKDVASGAT